MRRSPVATDDDAGPSFPPVPPTAARISSPLLDRTGAPSAFQHYEHLPAAARSSGLQYRSAPLVHGGVDEPGAYRPYQPPTQASAPRDMAVYERLVEALDRFRPSATVPGDPGPYEGGQDFPRWRKYMLKLMRANRWTLGEFTHRLSQYLDGPAAATYETIRRSFDPPTTAEDWLDAIGAVHCDLHGAQLIAEAKFQARRQKPTETIYEFVQVFESLAADCHADDRMKIRTFLQNVHPAAREPLTRRAARTWPELQKAAMIEQQVLDGRPAAAMNVYDDMYIHQVPTDQPQRQWYQQGSYAAYQGAPSRYERQGATQRPPDPITQLEQKLDRLAEILLNMNIRNERQPRTVGPCHSCGQMGHLRRACPKQGNGTGAGGAAQPSAPTRK